MSFNEFIPHHLQQYAILGIKHKINDHNKSWVIVCKDKVTIEEFNENEYKIPIGHTPYSWNNNIDVPIGHTNFSIGKQS